MYMSSADPAYHRTRGMEALKKGKDIFNHNKDFELRKTGYEIFKKGVECLLTYAKLEPDQELLAKIKEHLTRWIEEA